MYIGNICGETITVTVKQNGTPVKGIDGVSISSGEYIAPTVSDTYTFQFTAGTYTSPVWGPSGSSNGMLIVYDNNDTYNIGGANLQMS